MKILVIDDEPAVLKMYRVVMEEAGHTVLVAQAGQTGVELAQTDKPDLIFLDIIMPVMNGFDVLSDLKKNPDTKDIPIYLLTNLPESSSGAKAKELGAAGYLVKAEVEPKELVNMLDTFEQQNKK